MQDEISIAVSHAGNPSGLHHDSADAPIELKPCNLGIEEFRYGLSREKIGHEGPLSQTPEQGLFRFSWFCKSLQTKGFLPRSRIVLIGHWL